MELPFRIYSRARRVRNLATAYSVLQERDRILGNWATVLAANNFY